MFDVKKMIEEIAAKKEIKNVSFVGCGGSLACFFAPHYYVTHEAKTLTTLYENANEFTNDTPAFINENAIVVCASRRGNTPQTVEAAKKAKEYLDMMAFSRRGLIDQLKFEGFTEDEAEYGATSVGY